MTSPLISRCKRSLNSESGYTLTEILMVVLLIGILSVVSISMIGTNVDQSRFDQSVAEMQALRDALIGDVEAKEGTTRVSFNFLGDVGRLPTNAEGLNALLTNPSFPTWTVSSAARITHGWNGPYLKGTGVSSSFLQDAWGRNYLYDSTTDPTTIRSLGADGVVGGTLFNQDITVQIPSTLVFATVHGFISNNGSPYSGAAVVEANFPAAGALSTSTVTLTAAQKGYFSFSNVPFGRRSVTIYVPDKVSPMTTIGPVVFTVDSSNYVIPTSMTDFATGPGPTPTPPTGPTPTPTPPPCTPFGALTYVAGSASQTGGGKRTLIFSANITSNITVSALKITSVTKASPWDRVILNGITRSCTNPNLIVPCPANDATVAALSPTVPLSTGNNRTFEVRFSNNMTGETSVVYEVTHNLGCELLNIPIP